MQHCELGQRGEGDEELCARVGSNPNHTKMSFTETLSALDASTGWVTALQILRSLSDKALQKFPFEETPHKHTRRSQTQPSTPCTVIYSSVPLRSVREDKRVQRTMIILQIIKNLSEKQIPPAQSKPPLGKPFQAPSKTFLQSLSPPGTPLPVCIFYL